MLEPPSVDEEGRMYGGERNELGSMGTKIVPADPQKSSALTNGEKDSDQSCDILIRKDHKQVAREVAWKEKTAYNVNHRENGEYVEFARVDQSVFLNTERIQIE